MCLKSFNVSNLISANLQYFDCGTLVNIYKCYIRPVLEYDCVIYSPHNTYLIDAFKAFKDILRSYCLDFSNVEYVD